MTIALDKLLDQVDTVRRETKHLQVMLEARANEWQQANGYNRARGLIKKARWLNLILHNLDECDLSIKNAERE